MTNHSAQDRNGKLIYCPRHTNQHTDKCIFSFSEYNQLPKIGTLYLMSLSLFFLQWTHYSILFKELHLIVRNKSSAFEPCIFNRKNLLISTAQMLQERKVRMRSKGTLDNLLPHITQTTSYDSFVMASASFLI